jgi:hypothetical protein
MSIQTNTTIDWLFITDCEIPIHYPKNIRFVSTTLKELNLKVNSVVGVTVPLTPRKFCDLKPAYGAIFQDYISGYDFWGFCDMDIIWGDIRKFMSSDILENYDIISSRKEAVSGHFTLFRNTSPLINLYRQVPNYQFLFEQPKFMWFDESVLTNYIKNEIINNTFEYNVYWPKILLNQERGIDSWQGYYLDKWQWQKGKMIDLEANNCDKEIMYLHFISWKRKMNYCFVNYEIKPENFYVSYDGIKSEKNSKITLKLNILKNKIYGFWIREKVKANLKRYKKRIKRKLRIS